ncbi:MAG: hypothetical protein GY749_17175 [Desulfobacteraceae bacterium]|nr:hypothetical protein [Desulfobacteraceae bacterium]MCP4347050.1 hypothetical protein [Desulfobacterales bacterium]
MELEKIKQLEAKLREMLELSEKNEDKHEQQEKPDVRYVIRRRKGEEDKRINLA